MDMSKLKKRSQTTSTGTAPTGTTQTERPQLVHTDQFESSQPAPVPMPTGTEGQQEEVWEPQRAGTPGGPSGVVGGPSVNLPPGPGGEESGEVRWGKQVETEPVHKRGDPVVTPKTLPFNLSAPLGAPDSPEVVMGNAAPAIRLHPEVAKAMGREPVPPVRHEPPANARQSLDVGSPPATYSEGVSADPMPLNPEAIQQVIQYMMGERFRKTTMHEILGLAGIILGRLAPDVRERIVADYGERCDAGIRNASWATVIRSWVAVCPPRKLAGVLLMLHAIGALRSEIERTLSGEEGDE